MKQGHLLHCGFEKLKKNGNSETFRIISYCVGGGNLSSIVTSESDETNEETVFDLSDLLDKSVRHDAFESSNSFGKN